MNLLLNTFVSMLTPAFEEAYAVAPGNCPLSKPEIEEILMIDPFLFESCMSLHTYFETNHVPVRFVLNTLFHSSSDKSKGELTFPAQHNN